MTNNVKWDYPHVFTLDVVVDAAHIDGLGHANNAVYVNWCEQAAWAHSEKLGLRVDDYQRLDRAMAIRHGSYDYVASAYLSDRLQVGTWLLSSGKLKMQRHFQIIREGDGQTLLRGQWALVCIELSTGRPRRMPEEFDRCYSPAVITSADA